MINERGPPFVSDFAIQVTFSARISNCVSTAPSSLCEWSSTTSTFHFPGGSTDLIASKNSGMKLVVRRNHDETLKGAILLRTIVINEVVILKEQDYVAKFHKRCGYFRCLLDPHSIQVVLFYLIVTQQCSLFIFYLAEIVNLCLCKISGSRKKRENICKNIIEQVCIYVKKKLCRVLHFRCEEPQGQ